MTATFTPRWHHDVDASRFSRGGRGHHINRQSHQWLRHSRLLPQSSEARRVRSATGCENLASQAISTDRCVLQINLACRSTCCSWLFIRHLLAASPLVFGNLRASIKIARPPSCSQAFFSRSVGWRSVTEWIHSPISLQLCVYSLHTYSPISFEYSCLQHSFL